MITKEDLISFESEMVERFNSGTFPVIQHFCGGNEDELIEIFKHVKKEDWVFGAWRSHYHYLLKGGDRELLKQHISTDRSMHLMDAKLRFFATAIVGGQCSIATGVALSIKRNHGEGRVWCFCGDGCEDEGSFYEAVRYSEAFDLPIKFIIEDNNLAVDTTKKERINDYCVDWSPKRVMRYNYIRKYPHCQSGKYIEAYSESRYM
jgi:acetoin:2,6-dichlorophenolindophenol oxidoreductase subunit alpha